MIDSTDTNEINLGYSFVIANSDSLWCGEDLLSGDSAYIIDYGKGLLRIKEVCSKPLKFKFSHLDFPLNKTYSRWEERTYESLPLEVYEDVDRQYEDKLIINGNKGLFVDVRTGGTDISQSLWMEIGGEAGNFNVSGVLSDENIPQGNVVSQDLREVDEIFVEAVSDNMSFRVGDIVIVEEETDKRLLGLSSTWEDLYGVFGVSKAKYGRTTFKTKENQQGPYKIKPGEDIEGFSIVRGSEKVYLDGELLEEGADKDYTINHTENSLTFNPSIFIDNESVVLVIFQYSVYGDNSIFYKAGFEEDNYSVYFKREEDVAETDLVEFYPDSGFGYRFAAVNVGEGKGDYIFQDSIFVYEGYEEGSYEVYFQWVGEGNGEYEYLDSLHYFIWTGDGSYSAKRKIPLGEEDNLFSIELNEELDNLTVSGRIKARRMRIPVGGEKRDGLNSNIKSNFIPFDFFHLTLNYSKRTPDYVVKEWEGEKNLLKTWEIKGLPSDFIESSAEFVPNTNIKVSYLYGKADTLRKDRINLMLNPLYFEWDYIREHRTDLKGGLKFDNYDFSYRNLSRGDDYRKEFSAGSSFLTVLYGLEGNDSGDTAKVYTGRTNFKYKIATLTASHVNRRNLNSGQVERIINGTFDVNLNLESFYLRSKFNLSQKRASIWERYYQKVRLGEGDYSYDSTDNSYYENPYGDYVRRIIYTGEERDSREFSTKISIRSERFILLNGYLNSTYSPDLMSGNEGLLNIKFPEKSKNKGFFRINFTQNKGEDFWGNTDRFYGKINLGWENSSNGYKEIGLTGQWDTKEDRAGGYMRFWAQSGFEIKLEGLFTFGEDTLVSPIVELGYRLSGDKRSGLVKVTLGYNHYTAGNINSYRMNDLYPPGFFYDLTSSAIFDLTEKIHLVLNGNIHKLSSGEIYYNGRMGITADFSP
jgi:hypothetical protein